MGHKNLVADASIRAACEVFIRNVDEFLVSNFDGMLARGLKMLRKICPTDMIIVSISRTPVIVDSLNFDDFKYG